MLSPCSHICQVRKFWPCNSLSFLPFTLLSCMIHCVAEVFWILKLQFHSDWSAPVRGCIHSMSECLSVSLNLSQSLCGVEGLSVTSHLLWWFKTQVMYVELESFDPAKYSFLPSFLPCMIHFLAVFLYILKIQCSSNCSTAVRGCIHIMRSECLSVSLNLVQHLWWSGDLSASLYLLCRCLIHVKVTSLLPPTGKFVSADCVKCQTENMLWDRSKHVRTFG